MKIITKEDKSIPLMEMKDGDIARIVRWGYVETIDSKGLYCGEIVQRYRDYLLCVGKSSDNGWGKIFNNKSWSDMYRVEILPKGTILEIE